MKTNSRLVASLADAKSDSQEIAVRVKHGLAKSADASTNIVVSIVVNTISVLFSLIGEIITWAAKKPITAILIGITGGILSVGIKHTEVTDHQLSVDWEGMKNDLSLIYDDTKTTIMEYDYAHILPASMTSRFNFSTEEDGNTESTEGLPVITLTQPDTQLSETPISGQVPDVLINSSYQKALPETISPATLIAPTHKVVKNAYNTARINQLQFRPGSNIRFILRHCMVVKKNAYIKFSIDLDGYIADCHAIE